MTLWIDVEDLFEYALINPRPSGVQRLCFELCRALVALCPEELRFCRHDRIAQTMRVIDWAEVEHLFRGITAEPAAKARSGRVEAVVEGDAVAPPGRIRYYASRLPADIRVPLGDAMRAQGASLRAALRVLRALPGVARRLRRPRVKAGGRGASPAGADVARLAQPGDILLALGSPWFRTDYADLVARLQAATGLRFGLLVYDLIPVVRPEFCDAGLVRNFTAWLETTLPLADHIFAISHATAADVASWARARGIALRGPVHPIPIGTGFSDAPSRDEAPLPAGLVPGGYVLVVSTIEARKNHLLAFRLWRRLLEEMPAEQVPKLVFAGRVGWMIADLMQQIANTRSLDGKLVLIRNPSDAELATLYRGCRFTLFPSFYEGWGLPITESLGFGKACLAADRASMPEAGGPFCRYFDPDDLSSAVRVVREALEDPALIPALEARIAAEFQPVPWSETARMLLQGLGVAR